MASIFSTIVQFVLGSNRVKIGEVYADIFDNIDTADSVEITQYPIGNIGIASDHAIRQPTTLSFECSFREAYLAVTGINYIQDEDFNKYNILLGYQRDKTLVTIVTPKRVFKNMMIKHVGHVVNEDNFTITTLKIEAQEVLVAYVDTVKIPFTSLEGTSQSSNITDDGAGSAAETDKSPPQSMLKKIQGGFS